MVGLFRLLSLLRGWDDVGLAGMDIEFGAADADADAAPAAHDRTPGLPSNSAQTSPLK